jgi:hypothetical protein
VTRRAHVLPPAEAEDAIDRYLSAVEAGTLPEAQCAKRLEGLAAKVRDLRERREELVVAGQQASPPHRAPRRLPR